MVSTLLRLSQTYRVPVQELLGGSEPDGEGYSLVRSSERRQAVRADRRYGIATRSSAINKRDRRKLEPFVFPSPLG